MQILKTHSHKQGLELLNTHAPHLVPEVIQIIENIDAPQCLTKLSFEASKLKRWGGLVFSPRTLNLQFKQQLADAGWQRYRLSFADDSTASGADRFREIDAVKANVGLEIQFGKYAFMGYDIFSKMIIFRNKGIIDLGIEVVPVQKMVDCMSTGVSAFEHLMIDFVHRGEADIDVPVAVFGIGATEAEWAEVEKIQALYKIAPVEAKQHYPFIGTDGLGVTKPGPKSG